jgi:hypothetical protein
VPNLSRCQGGKESLSHAQKLDSLPSRKLSLYIVLVVAAAANVFAITTVSVGGEQHSERSLYWQLFLPVSVFLEYAMSCAAVAMDSLIAFRGGFLVTAAIILTLASGALAALIVALSMYGWQDRVVIVAISFLLFCVLCNLAFLAFASLHAYRIRSRTTVLGAVIGTFAALVLPWIVLRSWSQVAP